MQKHIITALIGFLIVFVVIKLFVNLVSPWINNSKTQSLVRTEAAAYLGVDNRSAHDVWGNSLKYHKIITDEAIMATVTSPGADGQFDTADDIAAQEIDYNKTYIVGKYVGKRAKEAASGLWKGLKEKSGFDN